MASYGALVFVQYDLYILHPNDTRANERWCRRRAIVTNLGNRGPLIISQNHIPEAKMPSAFTPLLERGMARAPRTHTHTRAWRTMEAVAE